MVEMKVDKILGLQYTRLEGYWDWTWSLQESDIAWNVDCVRGAPVICIGVAPGTVDNLEGTFCKAWFWLSVGCSTYDHNTTLEECADGFDCGLYMG